jgi:hypothetical protein
MDPPLPWLAALAAVSDPKARPAAAITEPTSTGQDRPSRRRSRDTASRDEASLLSIESRFMASPPSQAPWLFV